jgi:hypothetical protein
VWVSNEDVGSVQPGQEAKLKLEQARLLVQLDLGGSREGSGLVLPWQLAFSALPRIQ